ncbi:unnamed protein product [Absidia cylindrospora]
MLFSTNGWLNGVGTSSVTGVMTVLDIDYLNTPATYSLGKYIPFSSSDNAFLVNNTVFNRPDDKNHTITSIFFTVAGKQHHWALDNYYFTGFLNTGI